MSGGTVYECPHHDNCDGGCGQVYHGDAVQKAIEDALKSHIQSHRNKRCSCGNWRPDYNSKDPLDLFPEHSQHRKHVAEVIFGKVRDAL